jgi:hypothetical protein
MRIVSSYALYGVLLQMSKGGWFLVFTVIISFINLIGGYPTISKILLLSDVKFRVLRYLNSLPQ